MIKRILLISFISLGREQSNGQDYGREIEMTKSTAIVLGYKAPPADKIHVELARDIPVFQAPGFAKATIRHPKELFVVTTSTVASHELRVAFLVFPQFAIVCSLIVQGEDSNSLRELSSSVKARLLELKIDPEEFCITAAFFTNASSSVMLPGSASDAREIVLHQDLDRKQAVFHLTPRRIAGSQYWFRVDDSGKIVFEGTGTQGTRRIQRN